VGPADLIACQRVGLARAAAHQERADPEFDEALERFTKGVLIERLGRSEHGAVSGEQLDRRHLCLLWAQGRGCVSLTLETRNSEPETRVSNRELRAPFACMYEYTHNC